MEAGNLAVNAGNLHANALHARGEPPAVEQLLRALHARGESHGRRGTSMGGGVREKKTTQRYLSDCAPMNFL